MDTLYPINAVAGAPAYSGRMLRQANSVFLAGATAARPLGARSGVRPGTSLATVTATSTTWTCGVFAGAIDAEAAAEAGPYLFAFDAAATGAVTAANASNPRVDIIYVQIDDPSESDGTSVPVVRRGYLAGVAAATPSAPAAPARSFAVAQINVPKSGGGAPTVTWVAPYAVAAGGIVPFDTVTQRDSFASAAGVAPAWNFAPGDTAWITPTLTNGWVVFEGRTVKYRRKSGVVFLKGCATGGTSAAMFTLPPGFRPAPVAPDDEQFFSVMNGATTSGTTRIVVQPSGVVLPVTGTQPHLEPVQFGVDA